MTFGDGLLLGLVLGAMLGAGITRWGWLCERQAITGEWRKRQ